MKKNKINVGFVLNYSYHSWIGGYNYHLNLFKCLNKFKDKINIIIFVNKNISKHDQNLLKRYKIIKTDKFDYSVLRNKVGGILSKFKILFNGRDSKLDQFFKKYRTDVVSHFTYLGKKSLVRSLPIIWDFQELHNAKNFTYKDIFLRKINSIMCSKHSDKVILGGNHALIDYKKLLNKKKTNGVVISQPYFLNFKIKKKSSLFKKYNIVNQNYYLLPNQYWLHKNHFVVLKAPLIFLLDKEYLISKINNLEPREVDNKYINFTIFENNNVINVFFDKENLSLVGWQTEDIYQNLVITFISSVKINQKINNKIFILPKNN